MPWICLVILTSYLWQYGECSGYGFTYSTFTGPVSGPTEEIVVPVYHYNEANEDPNSPPPKRVDYVVSILVHALETNRFYKPKY